MIYSAEVEHMCPLTKGACHNMASLISREVKWVQAKEYQRDIGIHPRCGLVCTSARRL